MLWTGHDCIAGRFFTVWATREAPWAVILVFWAGLFLDYGLFLVGVAAYFMSCSDLRGQIITPFKSLFSAGCLFSILLSRSPNLVPQEPVLKSWWHKFPQRQNQLWLPRGNRPASQIPPEANTVFLSPGALLQWHWVRHCRGKSRSSSHALLQIQTVRSPWVSSVYVHGLLAFEFLSNPESKWGCVPQKQVIDVKKQFSELLIKHLTKRLNF